MLAGLAFGQPKAQLPPDIPKTLGDPIHLPLAVIWYPGAPTSLSGRCPPCLPYYRPGKKKKGRRRKGKKEAKGIEVKMEMRGLITAHGRQGINTSSFPPVLIKCWKRVSVGSTDLFLSQVLDETCLHEVMGLATLSHDMISHSLPMEFDTFLNLLLDQSSNHVGIDVNPISSKAYTNVSDGLIGDGKPYNVSAPVDICDGIPLMGL
uniref:Legume lectin domain-containing protein n=1 Tax=Oryza barthii TaxID=65489 RepID=A0A0D3H6E9_9ORYZ